MDSTVSGAVLNGPAGTADAAARCGTTLVVGVVHFSGDRPTATLVRIGDGGAWILGGRRYDPVFGDEPASAGAVLSTTVTSLPYLPERIELYDITVPPDGVLLVGTDGFAGPLGDGDGLVGSVFADLLAVPPSPYALAHALDFSRETFDDDRTLLAVWPRRPESRRTT